MNKKKVLLSVLTIVLICALSVTGTLAFLKEESADVTNKFVAQGGGKILDDHDEGEEASFKIVESPVKYDEATGNYVVDTEGEPDEDGIEYEILPGSEIAKEAKIDIIGKTSVASYLYVEVVNKLSNIYDTTGSNSVEAQLAANGWTKVEDANAQHEGTVYVYKDILQADENVGDGLEDFTGTDAIKLMEKLIVKDDADVTGLTEETPDSLSFYAYLAQATAGEGETTAEKALSAFNNCFKAPNP